MQEATMNIPGFTELEDGTLEYIDGKFEVLKDSKPIEVSDTKVLFNFIPAPRLYFTMKTEGSINDISAKYQVALKSEEIIEVFCVNNQVKLEMNHTAKSELIMVPQREPVEVKFSESKLRKLCFVVVNFKHFMGNNFEIVSHDKGSCRISFMDLIWKNWKIKISGTLSTKDNVEKANTDGYAFTHTGILEKIDGEEFEVKDIEPILSGLQNMLSFAMGRKIEVAFPTGLDSKGNKVWQKWGMGRCQRFSDTTSWFDLFNSQMLENIFQIFMDYWNNPDWNKTISEVIYWYNLANERDLSTGIVLAQIALEQLSWQYLVNIKKAISEKGFNDLRASDRFRLLCSHLSLPKAIPPECKKLKGIKSDPFWDSLWALTDVRNSIVHPKDKDDLAAHNVQYEAWKLGMWYLELVLLRLFDYNGNYSNRLIDSKWAGEVEQVPWATSAES